MDPKIQSATWTEVAWARQDFPSGPHHTPRQASTQEFLEPFGAEKRGQVEAGDHHRRP